MPNGIDKKHKLTFRLLNYDSLILKFGTRPEGGRRIKRSVKKLDERLTYEIWLSKEPDFEIERTDIIQQFFDINIWMVHGRVVEEFEITIESGKCEQSKYRSSDD